MRIVFAMHTTKPELAFSMLQREHPKIGSKGKSRDLLLD
jgi:hypothetical protein